MSVLGGRGVSWLGEMLVLVVCWGVVVEGCIGIDELVRAVFGWL